MPELTVLRGFASTPEHRARVDLDPDAWPQVFSRIRVGPGVWARTKHGRLFHLVRGLTVYRHIRIGKGRQMLDVPPHERAGEPSHIAVDFLCGNGGFDSGLTYHEFPFVLAAGKAAVCPRCAVRA